MGLSLRCNLFHRVDHASVYATLTRYYAQRGERLVEERDRRKRFDLREQASDWTVLDWNAGWEWTVRRRAQLFVSRELSAVGLLVFVFDGDYWGYELFAQGEVVDRFVQWPDEAATWFGDADCRGDAEVLSREIGIDPAGVTPYLVQEPIDQRHQDRWETLAVRARAGDRYQRFHECAVVDFVSALGVPAEVRDQLVVIGGDVWRSFRPQR